MSVRSRNAFLRCLPAASFERLRADLVQVRPRLGDVLAEPGQPVRAIYFPVSCVLSSLIVDGGGGKVETAMVGNEGACGIVGVLGSGLAVARTVVQVDGAMLQMPTQAFREAAYADAALTAAAMRLIEMQMGEIRQSGLCQAYHPGAGRFARWILESQDRAGGRKSLPLTQAFIASMLGVQRTTVSEFARPLQEQGLIVYRRGIIDILDVEALERRACRCRAAGKALRKQLGLPALPIAAEPFIDEAAPAGPANDVDEPGAWPDLQAPEAG